MLQQCSARTTFRDAAVLGSAVSIVLSGATYLSDSLFVCLNVAARTMGTVVVTFQGSLDGSTWFELSAALGTTLSANGLTSLPITGSFPRYLRVTLTPAGSFDGTLEGWIQGPNSIPALV